MARLPRLLVPGEIHLVLQRGLGSPALFADDDERLAYLAVLARMAGQSRVEVHAFALLPDLVLLLLTPRETHGAALDGLSLLMQCLAREHVRFVNSRRARSGTLWQGRFQAAPVEAASFGLTCWRFVEQAPVRCGMGAQALAYPWSSAGHYGGRAAQPWLVDHPLRWALGNTPFDREAAHRVLLDDPLSPVQVAQVESTALKGWALGSVPFLADLQTRVGRRLQAAARGRPRKGLSP